MRRTDDSHRVRRGCFAEQFDTLTRTRAKPRLGLRAKILRPSPSHLARSAGGQGNIQIFLQTFTVISMLDRSSQPQSLVCEVVDLLDLSQGLCVVEFEVLEQSVVESKHPTMHDWEMLLLIRILYRGSLDDITALLNNI